MFCPQATVLGNVAEWLGVLVATGAAIAVFMLGKKANDISHLTRELHDQENDREARGILGYIQGEAVASYRSLERMSAHLTEVSRSRPASLSVGFWQDITQQANGVPMRAMQEVRSRAHVLPDGLSDVVFRLVGNRTAFVGRAYALSTNLPAPGADTYDELDRLRDLAQVMVVDMNLIIEAARERAL